MRYYLYTKVNPVKIDVEEFESREKLLNEVRTIGARAPGLWRQYEYDYNKEPRLSGKFGVSWNEGKKHMVIDGIGRKVPAYTLEKWLEDFEPERTYIPRNRFRRWGYSRSRMHEHPNWLGFRSGPVPYTGNYGGCRGTGPKIGSERRAAQDGQYVRKKRSFKRLEVGWWRRRGYRGRTWKNQKKRKQWM